MALTNELIMTFIGGLFWAFLDVTPGSLKLNVYALIIATHEILLQLLLSCKMEFAPGLLEVLQSESPPGLAYFKSLPLVIDRRWGVYILVLEKSGERPKLYTGSGTYTRGISARMGQYRRGEMIPHWVSIALNNGYKITHKGLVCWSPNPAPSVRFATRACFHLAECFFSLYFWTMVSRTTDYGMPHICPWDIDTLEYDGCCGHTCLNEGLGDMHQHLTSAQINALDAERKLKNSRRDATTRGPERTALARKTLRTKALSTNKFLCEPCNINCSDNRELKNHQKTEKHKRNAAGIVLLPQKTRVANKRVELHAANIAARRFCCDPCGVNVVTQSHLNEHFRAKSHIKMMALQSSTSLDSL